MRKKIVKIIMIIFILIMATNIIFTFSNKCQAVTDVTENTEFWRPTTTTSTEELKEKVNIIVTIINVIGIIVSVVTLSVIGIKFMLGSVEERAQYKQTLMPWIVGAMMVFSITTIPSLIFEMVYDPTTMQSPGTGGGGETPTPTPIPTPEPEPQPQEPIKTTSINISKTSLTLNAPITMTSILTATKIPSNSEEPITWITSDSNVATVQNGKVKAVGVGTARITAKSGTKSATCVVEVTSGRKYFAQYYNPSTGKVTTSRTTKKDMGFWTYIPDISQVKNLDKIPLIVFLHGLGECR